MMPGDITCARCGWRNDASARMCGGCGQPLRSLPAPPTIVATPGGWAGRPEPGATTPVAAPAPFNQTMAAPTAGPYSQAPVRDATPSIWPAPVPGGVGASSGRPTGAKPSTKRKHPWRVLITLLVVLCVLLVVTLGAWALVVRPAIHHSVDSRLRAALDTAVEQAAPLGASIPAGAHLIVTISASTLNASIQSDLSGIPVQNVQVHFRGAGFVAASYTFLGRDGTILTQLIPLANGRVHAQNTSVTDLLQLVESADEMTAAFDEALGRLPSQYRVTQITASGDALSISVTTQ